MDYGTAATGATDEPLTIEKLKEAMALLPKPVGYALLKGSSLVNSIYRISNQFDVPHSANGKVHKFILVVPSRALDEIVSIIRAYPIDEDTYEYPIYSLLKDDIV